MHIRGSITMHTGGSILFILHVKWMVRFFFITSIFLIVVLYEYV